jgi:hypothetical protein
VNVLRLARVGKPGNELPNVGQACLVLKGDAHRDVGQECVVTPLGYMYRFKTRMGVKQQKSSTLLP